MLDSVVEALVTVESDEPDAVAAEKLTRVSINRLAFVMKGLAENNLWDEAERYLEESGCRDLLMSEAPIRLLQAMIRERVGAGAAVGKRVGRFMNSATCGGGSSPGGGGPAKSPGSGGGGDGGVKKE